MKALLFGFEGRISGIRLWAVQIPVLILFWPYGQHVDPLLARWFPYSVFKGLSFAIVIKRCHDRGKSGFRALLLLIPVLGFLWRLIDCGLLPSAKD